MTQQIFTDLNRGKVGLVFGSWRCHLMEKEHLEIILESIDSKFNLVLEGHDTEPKK